MFRTALRSTSICLTLAIAAFCQTSGNPEIPRIDRSGKRAALIVDGAPYLMLGAQMNNSSASASTMPQVWPAMAMLGVNTLEAPIYWEQLEPAEGKFDFSSVDLLLAQAREHRVRLVLLWFGTWKNGSHGYAPEWVKLDQKRFPLATAADGRATFSLSPFGEQTLQADKKAFTELMAHLNPPTRSTR